MFGKGTYYKLAPIIKIIFYRYLQTEQIPADWGKSDVMAVLIKVTAEYRQTSLAHILHMAIGHVLV